MSEKIQCMPMTHIHVHKRERERERERDLTRILGEHHPFRTLNSSRSLFKCYNELTEVKWICLWYDVKPLKSRIQLVSQIYK